MTFARVTKGSQESKPSPPIKPKIGITNNEDGSYELRGPNNTPLPSWSDDVPPGMDIIDNTITPTESRDIAAGTKAGGSMHEKSNEEVEFKTFIKDGFLQLTQKLEDFKVFKFLS